MNRRDFLTTLPALASLSGLACEKSSLARYVSSPSSPGSEPALVACHVGFRPDAQKRLILRSRGPGSPSQITLRTPSGSIVPVQVPQDQTLELDPFATAVDLPNLTEPGEYRASYGSNPPILFSVRPDVWTQITPSLVAYQTFQRCGHSRRKTHATCHLDDARRRDNNRHADTSGGWHDAGDLRKWTDSTLMNLFGLLALARRVRTNKNSFPLPLETLLDEARYGNTFFLKMQDSDGLIWSDVGGGINGDNSDNHWTDNIKGTADDRWINVQKRASVQAMFVAGQATIHQAFVDTDPTYASACLAAASRCWAASTRTVSNTTDLAWWSLAATEMYRGTRRAEYRDELILLANKIAGLQVTQIAAEESTVHGFYPMWPGNAEPLRDPVHSGLPAYALLRASEALSENRGHHPDSAKWDQSAQIYLDEYAAPMAARSAYGIVPFGLFLNAPAAENYRSLGTRYSYRFFMPVQGRDWWVGINAHLLSHSLLFAQASQHFGKSSYRDLAYRQIEWVFGGNPFGASLATGIGRNSPTPFSKFAGPINGGIMNGIGGDDQDNPTFDPRNPENWRLNEYWSNHNGYCQWALSVLET